MLTCKMLAIAATSSSTHQYKWNVLNNEAAAAAASLTAASSASLSSSVTATTASILSSPSPLTLSLVRLIAAVLIVVFIDRLMRKGKQDTSSVNNNNGHNKVSKGQVQLASNLQVPPGPMSFPLIGGLWYMAKYTDGPDAFNALNKQYGPIVSIRMGNLNSVLICGYDKIRQVLVTKSNLFDNRPELSRVKIMFHGNRNHSIAFSDGDALLRRRRDIIKLHTFPRFATFSYNKLDGIATEHLSSMFSEINRLINATGQTSSTFHIKPFLGQTLGKIFVQYMFGVTVEEDDELFQEMVKASDTIFQAINEPCVGDLIPSLMGFCEKPYLREGPAAIRKFLVTKLIRPRLLTLYNNSVPNDDLPSINGNHDINNNVSGSEHPRIDSMNDDDSEESSSLKKKQDILDAMIQNTSMDELRQLCGIEGQDRQQANNSGKEAIPVEFSLAALEDVLGGHSAICNFFIRILTHIAQRKEIQEEIRKEVDAVGSHQDEDVTGIHATLQDKLVYTEATVWEAVRHISSPIVPHVANCDTEIDGFAIPRGTAIFFNTQDLNFNPVNWDKPEEFNPSRFISEDGSQISRPEYFIPFSTGRRSCLGFKLCLTLATCLLANLCHSYDIDLVPGENYSYPKGSLAVCDLGTQFNFSQRQGK